MLLWSHINVGKPYVIKVENEIIKFWAAKHLGPMRNLFRYRRSKSIFYGNLTKREVELP